MPPPLPTLRVPPPQLLVDQIQHLLVFQNLVHFLHPGFHQGFGFTGEEDLAQVSLAMPELNPAASVRWIFLSGLAAGTACGSDPPGPRRLPKTGPRRHERGAPAGPARPVRRGSGCDPSPPK